LIRDNTRLPNKNIFQILKGEIFMLKRKLFFATSAALVLAACGAEDEADTGTNEQETTQESDSTGEEGGTIVVSSVQPPMTTIVEIAGENIADGYEVELLEVSDEVQYNEALANDEIDANFAQHEPYMAQFNENTGSDLVAIQPIYNAIVGFYSLNHESIDAVPEGAEIAIPSDPSNEARALLILDDHGYITLDEDAGYFATVDDIEENPHDFEFVHVDLANLNAAYEDGYDLVFHYPTFIEQVGLTPDDALLLEADPDFTFAISLVAREDNQDSEAIQALVDAFTSEAVVEYLEELEENGHLERAF
jgi:D-methionine transport system substrate-binding protein